MLWSVCTFYPTNYEYTLNYSMKLKLNLLWDWQHIVTFHFYVKCCYHHIWPLIFFIFFFHYIGLILVCLGIFAEKLLQHLGWMFYTCCATLFYTSLVTLRLGVIQRLSQLWRDVCGSVCDCSPTDRHIIMYKISHFIAESLDIEAMNSHYNTSRSCTVYSMHIFTYKGIWGNCTSSS